MADMNEGAPLSMLEEQINDDYYKKGLTFRQILYKYRRFDRKDLVKILHLYDLSEEPKPTDTGYGKFPGEWDAICRKLNPKAWEGR